MIYRPAKHSDIDAIVDLAVASVSVDPLPVRVSRPYMRAKALELVGHPSHFVWVAEDGGKVVACLAAQVMEGFWFERSQCSVLLFYGARVARLFRLFAQWLEGRSRIKLAVIEFEPHVDPRLVEYVRRLGFERQSINLTYVRKPL